MNLPLITSQTFHFPLKKTWGAQDFEKKQKKSPKTKQIQPPNESAPIEIAAPRCSKNPINADPKAYIDEIVESYAGPRWVAHNGASARHEFFFGAQKKSLKRHDFV